jgi:hypothetical protein
LAQSFAQDVVNVFNKKYKPRGSEEKELFTLQLYYIYVTEISQPCIHTCNGLFIRQLYSLPDLLEETECKEDMPLTLPFASFVSLSQLIIVI